VGGSGPQTLSTIAKLTDVTAYPIRSTIHDQSRRDIRMAVIFGRLTLLDAPSESQ
jgi:hypothetical protein